MSVKPFDSKILLSALQKGTVVNAGGILINCDCQTMAANWTAVYNAMQELKSQGYNIQRIDAGGRPEWKLFA